MLEKILGVVAIVAAGLTLGWVMAEFTGQPDPFYEPAAFKSYRGR